MISVLSLSCSPLAVPSSSSLLLRGFSQDFWLQSFGILELAPTHLPDSLLINVATLNRAKRAVLFILLQSFGILELTLSLFAVFWNPPIGLFPYDRFLSYQCSCLE